MRNIQFWYDDVTGYTGIQMLFEWVYPNSFKSISRDSINPNDTNIIVFRWETTNAINPTTLTSKPEFFKLISELNKMGFYFMADFSTEAEYVSTNSERILFLDKLVSLGIPMNRFILSQNNSFELDVTNMRCGNHIIKRNHFPHFLLSTPFYMNQYIDSVTPHHKSNPTKDFLCLNRRVHKHKYEMLKRLWEKGLLQKTNWTWVDTTMPFDEVDSDFKNAIGLDFEKSIQLDGDVMYGRELQYADEFLYTINTTWYDDSKVNIINETYPSNISKRIHITEKTWKAIYLGIPFVINATNGHLNRLKLFGFKTFGNLIDESYDWEVGVDSIINSAITLSKLWNSSEVVDICGHNMEKIKDKNMYKYVVDKWVLEPLINMNTNNRNII
jgi:hypothetical protein